MNSPITICRDSFDELIIAYKKEVGIDIAEEVKHSVHTGLTYAVMNTEKAEAGCYYEFFLSHILMELGLSPDDIKNLDRYNKVPFMERVNEDVVIPLQKDSPAIITKAMSSIDLLGAYVRSNIFEIDIQLHVIDTETTLNSRIF